jgi:DNA-binding transcriptional LysR family regulator
MPVPYSRHPIVVFVNRRHRFAGRRSIRMADLEGEPMIMREEGSTTRKALDEALAKARVKPRIAMEIGSREAIREAVIMDVGIAAVSQIRVHPRPGDPDGARERCRDVHLRPRLLPATSGARRAWCAPFSGSSGELLRQRRRARTRKKSAMS